MTLTAEQIATPAADDDFPVRLLLGENQDAVPADLVVRTYLEARVITRGELLRHPAIAAADPALPVDLMAAFLDPPTEEADPA